MTQTPMDRRAKAGLLGFILGVVALVAILVQLSALFEPQQKSAGTTIGEIAADIKQSAKRALTGEPAPERAPPLANHDTLIQIAAFCAAGLAVILGGIGLYRREPPQLSFLAIGIGISAFVMHYLFWLALLICGVVLLVSIISNLDSIFS